MDFPVVILALVALAAVDVAHAKYFSISDNGHKGECVVTRYIPGGSKADITQIKAPIAKLESNAITKLLGPVAVGSKVAMHGVKAAQFLGKLASLGSKLGPALGVFSSAMGLMDVIAKKPSMADLLKQINNAIEKLTHEVNERLDKMKGYVDEKIINLEKELMSRDYKHMFQMFALCIHEGNDRAQRRCMRNADRFQSAAYKKFATMDMPTGKLLDVFSVKKLEVNLLTFRDYVTLRVLTMRTLIDTYKDILTGEGQQYFKDYCNQIKEELLRYRDYVNKAYFQIKIGNTKPNLCKKTISCKPLSAINEGWPSVHTADSTTCKCQFDEFMPSCDVSITVRADGKHTYVGYPNLKTTGNNKDAASEVTLILLAKEETTYTHEMKALIQKYWTANLLNLLPKWKAIEDATYFVEQKIVEEVDPFEPRLVALEEAAEELNGKLGIKPDTARPTVAEMAE